MIRYVVYILLRTLEDEFYLHDCRIELFPSYDALLFERTLYALNEQLNTFIISRLEEGEMYFICILIFPKILGGLQYQKLQFRQVGKVHIKNFDDFKIVDLSL